MGLDRSAGDANRWLDRADRPEVGEGLDCTSGKTVQNLSDRSGPLDLNLGPVCNTVMRAAGVDASSDEELDQRGRGYAGPDPSAEQLRVTSRMPASPDRGLACFGSPAAVLTLPTACVAVHDRA